jgi:hypothetical protein
MAGWLTNAGARTWPLVKDGSLSGCEAPVAVYVCRALGPIAVPTGSKYMLNDDAKEVFDGSNLYENAKD